MFDSSETLLIGVDGGGSGCRVAIGTRGKGVISEGKSGSANVTTDRAAALSNIEAALNEALCAANVPHSALSDAVAFLGLAGVISDAIGLEVASQLPFKHAKVDSDRPTTLMGALDGGDGLVAAIGTGTFLASCKDGQEAFVGGWGSRVADQASGGWLGCQALMKTLLCYDGLENYTDLTRQLLRDFGNDPIEISNFSMSASPAEYARLCPTVIDAAKAGDPIACELLDEGTAYIFKALTVLGVLPHDEVVLCGGVGRFYKGRLSNVIPNDIRPPKNTTAIAAFKLAMQEECLLFKGES